MKKKIPIIIVFIVIFNLFIVPVLKARGFADYDDVTADAEAQNLLEQQEIEHRENIGRSNNNYLSELLVKNHTLIPAFDKQIIDYEIQEEITSNTIEIITKSDDEKASVSGAGIVTLQSGENNINIEVTAENGTVRTYHIKLKKKIPKTAPRLKNLKLVAINGNEEKIDVDIIPEFSENIYKYTCEVYNDIKKIMIDDIDVSKDIHVEIKGNENLEVGKNMVTISLKSNDEIDETIYNIEVVKKREEKIKTENTNEYLQILIGIAIILVIVIIIAKNKRKESKH